MSIYLSLFVLAVFALLFCSAFFSSSETALTAASRARMLQLEKDGNRRASIVSWLIERREAMIGTVLLGNTLINIAVSALTTVVFVEAFGEAGVAYATIITTALVLIFAEVLPKTLAITNSDRAALLLAPLLRVVVVTLGPIVGAVQWIVRHTLKLFGIDIDATRPVLSAHEELRGAIEVHHMEGGMVRADRDRFGGLLDLQELEVADVMIHRKSMVTADANQPTSDIVRQVLESPHTRIPLWRDDPDNIIGVLHARDLLRALYRAGNDVARLEIPSLLIKPWFVPETTTLQDQLDAFLRQRGHLALVVDEYGALMGLVTLEDILEEIVGDIRDEHDVPLGGVRPQANGSVIVDGWVPIRDLNRAMDWSLSDEEATTIAGLIIHEAQTIPDVGQIFSFHGYKFEILRRQRNQIVTIKVTPPKKADAI